MLGQFTPELCDAVLERGDSAETLAELERANLLLSRLEHGDLLRIHPLFAEYAGAQLEASDPGASSRIHLRAATWLRAQGRSDGGDLSCVGCRGARARRGAARGADA